MVIGHGDKRTILSLFGGGGLRAGRSSSTSLHERQSVASITRQPVAEEPSRSASHHKTGSPHEARMIKTGSPECGTTRSVTLPNTHRRMRERPWLRMGIKLSGVRRAILRISPPPYPKSGAGVIFSRHFSLRGPTLWGRYSRVSVSR